MISNAASLLKSWRRKQSGQQVYLTFAWSALMTRFVTSGKYTELFGCLTWELFEPINWAGFICALTIRRTSTRSPTIQAMFDSWMEFQPLQRYSDLAWFSYQYGPILIASSPWDLRPLGRPLPDIDSTCTCISKDSSFSARRWKVFHNAKAGMHASFVKVWVECSACQRHWHLPTSTLIGSIHEYASFFAVEIPLIV